MGLGFRVVQGQGFEGFRARGQGFAGFRARGQGFEGFRV